MPPLLYAIGYSPWSIKAQWALEHHEVAYQRREFLPLIGALGLRWATRRWRGPLTVPCLIDGGDVLMDSLAIAQAADAQSEHPTLFPEDRLAEVLTWNTCSETALSAGRVLTTLAVASDPVALRESVPKGIAAVPGLGVLFGRIGAGYLARKYAFSADQRAAQLQTLTACLDTLRAGLAAVHGDHLLGALSYADLTMAVALHFVLPPENLPIGPVSRTHWTRPELAAEYADLIAWRDRIFAAHGTQPARPT
jgi:glutathione S-transferase